MTTRTFVESQNILAEMIYSLPVFIRVMRCLASSTDGLDGYSSKQARVTKENNDTLIITTEYIETR